VTADVNRITTGQCPRQDLIPGNIDDGLQRRDDEAVSDDHDHTIATATVTSDATERPEQWGVLIP